MIITKNFVASCYLTLRLLSSSFLSIYLSLCSLCNTKATSKQTLLLHADGKKHRARARAFHAKQQPTTPDLSAPDANLPVENGSNEVQVNNNVEQPKEDPSNKKRKSDAVEDNPMRKKGRDDTSSEIGNGEVSEGEKAEAAERESHLKKERTSDIKKKINWKKFIKSALKSVCICKFGMTCVLVLHFILDDLVILSAYSEHEMVMYRPTALG